MLAMAQEDEGQGHFAQSKKKKGWARWRPSNEGGKIEYKKKVMGANGAVNKDSLVETQKKKEDAAKAVSLTKKSTRQKRSKAKLRKMLQNEKKQRQGVQGQLNEKSSGNKRNM